MCGMTMNDPIETVSSLLTNGRVYKDLPWSNPYRALGTVMQSLRSHLDPTRVRRQVP